MSDTRSGGEFVFHTALGWIYFQRTAGCVERLDFGLRSQERASSRCSASPVATKDALADPLVRRLIDYAEGKPEDFSDVDVLLTGPPFFRRALNACRRIPWGRTRTYGELAAEVGRPRACRSVGGAMASNRIPLIIPCHRVVGAGGRLVGYSAEGDVAMKRRLLELESALPLRKPGG